MNIVINPFDSKSIDKAIVQVKEYEKQFDAQIQEFVKRLAELGVSVAKVGFQTADYDGDKDVIVKVEQNGTTAVIVASGETVGFIEFGTGVKFPEWSGSTSTGYTPPKHGTYGKGRGANPKGWYFGHSQHTYGNMPAEAMLTARDVMVENITRIAREVWK